MGPPVVKQRMATRVSPSGSVTESAHPVAREGAIQGVLLPMGGPQELRPPVPFVNITRPLDVGRRHRGSTSSALALNDKTVSGLHAQIIVRGETFEIIDLDSRNGTTVNGRRIRGGRAILTDGALLFFGCYPAIFRIATTRQLEAMSAERERPLGPVLTASPEYAIVSQTLKSIAPHLNTIFLLGECGATCELVAEAIHDVSGRMGEFRRIDCSLADPGEMLATMESLKAPATLASRVLGTLFLDKANYLSVHLQARLFELAKGRSKVLLGSDPAVIVSASHLGNAASVERECLRPITFTIPPFRDRRCDLGRWVSYVLCERRRRARQSPTAPSLTGERWSCLAQYAFPGNAAELQELLTDCMSARAGMGGPPHTTATKAREPEEWYGRGATPPPEFLGSRLATDAREQAIDRIAMDVALTTREREVLRLGCVGLSVKEIAWELAVSPKTVEYFWSRIFEKTNCKSQLQAVANVLESVLGVRARRSIRSGQSGRKRESRA
jgi:DNA-binding CsgD family transcriptional regulator